MLDGAVQLKLFTRNPRRGLRWVLRRAHFGEYGMARKKGNGTVLNTLPREQIGAVTGEYYEFQYHQAAGDALQVLDDGKVACVYCEWHDDYVIETAGIASYQFHQVKARAKSRGPWSLSEFFGHRKKTTASQKSKTEASIFTNMIDHVSKFGGKCAAFVFVTDAGIKSDFQALLDQVEAAKSLKALPADARKTLASVVKGLAKMLPDLVVADLYEFLVRFTVKPTMGAFGERAVIKAGLLHIHVEEASPSSAPCGASDPWAFRACPAESAG